MLRLRKKSAQLAPRSLPLALRTVDGEVLYTFPTDVVDSMRQMATELIYNESLPLRLSMVSALSGEGVTYTSLVLGATLANDLPRSICVVELNWWAPGMLSLLTRGNPAPRSRKRGKAGLAENTNAPPRQISSLGVAGVLAGQSSLDDAMIKTAQSNLTLLPAGDLSLSQRHTVARSTSLRELIDALSDRFDHLILDIPAVLSTSDAIALASLSSHCCLVVRQGVTSKASIENALDDIKHLQMLGVVLNKIHIYTPRWVRALIPQD